MKIYAEPCPQGSRKQSAAGGCPYERKGVQVYLHAPRRRPFVYHYVNAVILHGRVKILFHYRRKAVNLVDEQHVVRFERSKQPGQVARLVEHRPRRELEAHAQFVGYDIRECGFSQAGRAVQERMVERFSAPAGRLDEDTQVFHHVLLAGKVAESQRPQRVLVFALRGGAHLLGPYVESIVIFHGNQVFYIFQTLICRRSGLPLLQSPKSKGNTGPSSGKRVKLMR